MDNQTQKKPVTAVRRGITGAIAGEAVMIVIFILVAASGAQVSFAYALIYLLFGPIYGFGFTFANWRLVAEKTKRGAVEGGAVLGIGIILSCLTENVKWGFWGWIYFVFRVSWHIGMCWIPGVWYGIQEIRLEKKELNQSDTVRPEAALPPRPAAASPVSQPVLQPVEGLPVRRLPASSPARISRYRRMRSWRSEAILPCARSYSRRNARRPSTAPSAMTAGGAAGRSGI